jgi:hypothetical protein
MTRHACGRHGADGRPDFDWEMDAREQAAQSMKADKGWQRRFDDPIPLPRGRQLVTLEDAAGYIMKLPRAEQQLEEWQTATEALIMAAEGRGPLLHARVGMLRR